MKRKAGIDLPLTELRQRAESALARRPCASVGPTSDEGARLLRELELHQIELELQNEALRAAQLELQCARDRYHELYDQAPVGYLALDRHGRIEECNLTASVLLGIPRTRLDGRPLAGFLDPSDADELHRYLQQIFAGPHKLPCNLTLRSGNGRAVPVRLESIASFDDSGRARGCHTALIDLSALHESEARFEQIADNIGDVFAIQERETGRVVYVNRAFEEIWGRPTADLYLTAPAWVDWIHPDDRERFTRAHRDMLHGDPFDEEHRVCRPDGEVRWVRARAFPVVEPDGAVQRDVFVFQDVTSERELELQLRQAQKMEAVGVLASGVAHDFNNVLQAILGCVKLASSEELSAAEAHEYLERAEHAVQRGSDLARQLTGFARKRRVERTATEVDAVIERLAPMLERLVTEQVALAIETRARGAMVLADPVQIEQILLNLAANASDAMDEGGTLSIRTESIELDPLVASREGHPGEGSNVVLSVSDTGAGMDERTLTRIFEPFFTTKDVGKGTGLGLSTVFSIVRDLEGQIEVESELGRGTRFSLCLPCTTGRQAPSSDRARGDLRLHGTALLVEDDPLVRMTVRHQLAELGLDVLTAGDASEARTLCGAHGVGVDLLVSDVVLPGTSGPTLAAELEHRYPGLQVLFISATPERSTRRRWPRGAPVLCKPFSRDELAEALDRLPGSRLSRGAPRPTAQDDEARQPPPSASDVPAPAEAARRPKAAAGPASVGPKAVLLVEDDPDSRAALGALLEMRGFRVEAFASAVEALEAAERGAPCDVLLTDVHLPGMSGSELAAELRDARPGVPVVFMSGVPDPPAAAGAFVQKPIELEQLLAILERALDQRTASVSTGG